MRDIAAFTRERSRELFDYLEACSETPLAFRGEYPITHSADNHIHLWMLEYLADTCPWITLAYRVAFAENVFGRWKQRLKGFAPYTQSGYRLYLYEDMAPTLSVVAETPYGCPYGGNPLTFVKSPADVMAAYTGRSWQSLFKGDARAPTAAKLLEIVDARKGSIGTPAAEALGMPSGALRKLIECMGIGNDVNAIRKRYRRRPAQFRQDHEIPYQVKIYEMTLPKGYA